MVDSTAVLPNSRAAHFKQRRAEAKKRELEITIAKRNKKPENETTAFKVFNHLFEVKVENAYLHSDAEIEMYGVIGDVIYGDSRDMQSTLKRLTTLSIPVSDMVDLREEGAELDFTKLSGAAGAYDVVMDHLEAWVDFINRPRMNQTYIPWEDIYALDKLAGYLFQKGRNYIATNEIVSDTTSMEDLIRQTIFGGNVDSGLSASERENGYTRSVGDTYNSIIDNIDQHHIPAGASIYEL